MKHSVHFPFSKNHNINTYSIDLLNGKCTECFIYHVGAHLKALGILVWILGPESTTANVLLCKIQCERKGKEGDDRQLLVVSRGCQNPHQNAESFQMSPNMIYETFSTLPI